MKSGLARTVALVFMVLAAIIGSHGGNLRAKTDQKRLRGATRVSFRQLCFSFAREGGKAQDAADRAFRKVSGGSVDADAGVADLADHFILSSYYGDRTPEQVAQVFGPKFAQSLFQMKSGSWQGPIDSELGWHLVWIDSIR